MKEIKLYKTADREKGITLIALVVTIIVLLILAGITISLVVGQNGIITRARQAKLTKEIADEKEAIVLAYTALELEKNVYPNNFPDGLISANKMKEEMDKGGIKPQSVSLDDITKSLLITFGEDRENREYWVTQSGEVKEKGEGDNGGVVATIPDTYFMHVKDGQDVQFNPTEEVGGHWDGDSVEAHYDGQGLKKVGTNIVIDNTYGQESYQTNKYIEPYEVYIDIPGHYDKAYTFGDVGIAEEIKQDDGEFVVNGFYGKYIDEYTYNGEIVQGHYDGQSVYIGNKWDEMIIEDGKTDYIEGYTIRMPIPGHYDGKKLKFSDVQGGENWYVNEYVYDAEFCVATTQIEPYNTGNYIRGEDVPIGNNVKGTENRYQISGYSSRTTGTLVLNPEQDGLASNSIFNFSLNPNIVYTIPSQINGMQITSINFQLYTDGVNKAYQNIRGVKSLILPDTVRTISANAFSGFDSLALIKLSPNITTIGENAFKDCTNLQTILITSEKVPTIKTGAFDNIKQGSVIKVVNETVKQALEGKYNTATTTVIVDANIK